MQALVDHLHARAERLRGTPAVPSGPRDTSRANALFSLAELLEEEPALVRPPTRETLGTFVVEPVSSLEIGEVLGPRASVLVAAYGQDDVPTSVAHLRLLDALAIAVVRDAWDMAAEIGDVLIRGGTSPSELAAVVGLDVWETEAAVAGHDPGDDYFARRPELSAEERVRWITSRAPLAGADAPV